MPEGDVITKGQVITRCRLCGADYAVSTMVKTNVWIDREGREHFAALALKPEVSQDFPETCSKSPNGRHEIIPNY